jgi:hypothetical protein
VTFLTLNVWNVTLLTLAGGVSEKRRARVQRRLHPLDVQGLHERSRRGHLPPHALDHRPQAWPGRPGDHEEVGVGGRVREGPAAAGERCLHPDPHRRVPGHGDDQRVRAAGGEAEQAGGQVHRSAPSRQA